jgi:hypothetical protein
VTVDARFTQDRAQSCQGAGEKNFEIAVGRGCRWSRPFLHTVSFAGGPLAGDARPLCARAFVPARGAGTDGRTGPKPPSRPVPSSVPYNWAAKVNLTPSPRFAPVATIAGQNPQTADEVTENRDPLLVCYRRCGASAIS